MRFALNIHILEQTQIVGDRKTLSLFIEIRKIVFFSFVFNDLLLFGNKVGPLCQRRF